MLMVFMLIIQHYTIVVCRYENRCRGLHYLLTSKVSKGRQIRNHLVAPLHTCPFFNIVILVEIWHAIHV